MRLRPSILFSVALLVAVEPALAKKTNARVEAKQHFQRAETSYKLGQFEDALKEYSKAYMLLSSPAFLFNIGQCHRNLGDYDRALYFFRGFMRASNDDATKKKVQGLITELEEKIAAREQEKIDAEQRAAAATSTQAAEKPPAFAVVINGPATQQPPEDEGLAAWPFIVAGIVAAALGGAAIAIASSSGGGIPDGLDPARTIDWRSR